MGAERPPLASVDSVRDELRRLGYLTSSLDRFVLQGAPGAPPLLASLRAALRVGLVGGLLLGLAATLAAAGLDRRLLAEPRDLVVLSLYLVAAFALATGAVALVGGLLAAWARRRGREPGEAFARRVGLAVAVIAALYFALWWRSHLGESGLAGRALAIAGFLFLSLALSRFASLAAVAVLAAGSPAPHLQPASLSRRRVLPLVLGAAAVFGAVLAVAPRLVRSDARTPPDFAVVPTGLRVRVLAVDGLERRMTSELVARGEMPGLEALLARGAHARLRAEPERVPAIVWTTIATGRGPAAHGILSPDTRRLTGLRTPVSLGARGRFVQALGRATDLLRLTRTQPAGAALRSVKTFWNVASEKGLRIGVVNWWATWPAETVTGWLVSDRAAFKIEKGGPPDREVSPAEAFETLRPLFDASEPDRALRLDRFHVAAARALRASGPAPDLEALYLSGLDIVTMQQLGDATANDLAALDARLALVRSHYRFLDGVIAEAAAGLGASDVLVVIGDPGRLAREAAEPAEGVLVLAGAAIAAGDLGSVSERDLAPTVLHLAGLPKSRELDGAVLEAALDGRFRGEHPVRLVDSYGRRPAARAAESAFDQDVLEQLKSLGYIQ